MNDDTEILAVLRSIDRRLALLTGDQERMLRARLRADILTTPGRLAMFDAIDGRTGSPEIAKAVGVSERSVQGFVKELLDLGLVRPVPGAAARGVIVERDDDALVRWYLDKAPADDNPSAVKA
jgi:hypothetical protein